jgi:hypothetical protein
MGNAALGLGSEETKEQKAARRAERKETEKFFKKASKEAGANIQRRRAGLPPKYGKTQEEIEAGRRATVRQQASENVMKFSDEAGRLEEKDKNLSGRRREEKVQSDAAAASSAANRKRAYVHETDESARDRY